MYSTVSVHPPFSVYLSSPEIPEEESHSLQGSHSNNGRPASVANLPVTDDSTLITRQPGRGKGGAISIHRVNPGHITSVDEYNEAGGHSSGGRDSILYPPARDTPSHPGFSQIKTPDYPSSEHSGQHHNHDGAASIRTSKTKKTTATAASETPSHKIAFQEFHAQLGVRLLKGSLGPVQDVPMMLKSGYRHVYVSRSFALNHGFIPKDTTPGTYGFNGITNLGKWPVQVGSKAVSCTVMLAEDSYFPVILGRTFMEKRGVRTDPVDMTSVVFMDTGEKPEVEVVVVRDEHGEPVPIP